MKKFLCLILIGMASPNPCHATTQKWNVLFISVDDLRNDLGALGAPHAKTPSLDAFASTARIFSHHYVQVPTCGASRCALLRGRYPSVKQQIANHATLATHPEWGSNSLPTTFRKNGYKTLALGKIGHFPGGHSGKHWIDGPEELPGAWDRCWVPESPWKSPEAMMHGYANGIARNPGKSPPIEAFDGPDSAYPDAWIADEASKTLINLSKSEKPWFFCVGFFKPHLPFNAPKRWLDLHPQPFQSPPVPGKPSWPSGWHNSGEFRGNYAHNGRDPDKDPAYAAELRRAYAASISYVDAQIGKVFSTLTSLGMEKNTVVVLWSDHGFLLGEHAIWGKHCLYENALRSPLMIRTPDLSEPGKTSTATVETVDVFPTLTDLCNLQSPPNLDGKTLRPHLKNPTTPSSKPARGFWTNGQLTLRNDRWRIITDSKGNRVELFDLLNDPSESKNVAEKNPETVRELKSIMLAE